MKNPKVDALEARAILEEHVNVGRERAVSYLPINAIENVLGLSIEDYRSLIERQGNECSVFRSDCCCIKSGAVFAYSPTDLDTILKEYASVLLEHGWPLSASPFVQRIASEWLEDDNPILPVIKRAFGEIGGAGAPTRPTPAGDAG